MSKTIEEVTAFLCGEAAMDGVWFGDKHPTEGGNFWWRKHLRAALSGQGEAVGYAIVSRDGEHIRFWSKSREAVLKQAEDLGAEIVTLLSPLPPDGWKEEQALLDFLCDPERTRRIECEKGLFRVYQDTQAPEAWSYKWVAMTRHFHPSAREAIRAAMADDGQEFKETLDALRAPTLPAQQEG